MPKVYAISDLHVDYAENMQHMLGLSEHDYVEDTLILAGDVSDSLDKLKTLLSAMTARFLNVCFVPGNHELWLREKSFGDSIEKFHHILGVCAELGVVTEPLTIRGKQDSVHLVPLFSWYRGDAADDQSLYIEKATEGAGKSRWMDDILCKWPDEISGGHSQVADFFCALNEPVINQPRDSESISYSHFLPRKELIFTDPQHAKQYSAKGAILPAYDMDPTPKFNFTRVAGCEKLDRQIRQVGSKLHVYGHQHSHRNRDLDGVTYVSNCVGYARERKYLGNNVKPLCIWDDGTFLGPDDSIPGDSI